MIIYHKVDMDGVTSAALVHNFLIKEGVESTNIKVVPHNYGFALPNTKGYTVYVVDLGMKFDDLKAISEECEKLIWIDHHYTAIKEYEERCSELTSEIDGYRFSNTFAACGLVYLYLYKNCDITQLLPHSIRLISDYDVWNSINEKYWEEEVMPYQMYMKTYFLTNDKSCVENLSCDLDLSLLSEYVYECIDKGVCMYDYQKTMWKAHNNYINVGVFHDFKVAYINSLNRNSHQFYGSKVLEEVDILCVYTHNNGEWEYSIYSTGLNPKLNCGEIAKMYGGGGHKNAAGFNMDKFLF